MGVDGESGPVVLVAEVVEDLGGGVVVGWFVGVGCACRVGGLDEGRKGRWGWCRSNGRSVKGERRGHAGYSVSCGSMEELVNLIQ